MYTIQEIKEMPFEERMKILEMRAKLQKKKAEVVGKVERIAKNGWNSFHNYEYSTESDIKEGVRKLLSGSGLTLDIEPIEETKQAINKGFLHNVKMEFILTDNDTGFMDIKHSSGEASDTGDKGIYKAYSGCIKYYLINNFLISTGEKDNDPESDSGDKIYDNSNKGNNNKNKNRGGNNNRSQNDNKQNQQKQQQQKPKASRSGIEAKWKQLNNGTLDGLDDYIQKKQAENKDIEWIDKVLLGKIQAKQAEKNKAKNEDPEDLKKDMEEAINSAPADPKDPEPKETVTDVTTGNTVEYNGKNITFE